MTIHVDLARALKRADKNRHQMIQVTLLLTPGAWKSIRDEQIATQGDLQAIVNHRLDLGDEQEVMEPARSGPSGWDFWLLGTVGVIMGWVMGVLVTTWLSK